MIFANHDFKTNFLGTINGKDMNISRELIISEIGKVIQSRPFQVRQLLVGCGVRISQKASLREVVAAVNFNLARNMCLRNGLAKLIVDNQMPYSHKGNALNSKYLNQNGPSNTGMTGSDWVSGVSTIIGIGYGIREGNLSREEAQRQREHEMELARMNQETMLTQMEYNANMPLQPITAGPNTGSKTIMWVLLGLGAVAITYMIIRGRKQNK